MIARLSVISLQRPRPRRVLIPAVIVAGALLSSCGATVYDESIAASTVAAPTTTDPVGTMDELLLRLSIEMNSLSTLIGPDQSGKTPAGRSEQFALIESIWLAVEDSVLAVDPAMADSLERMVALAQIAVERSRPADADKAARFAGQVISDFLTRQS